MYTTLKTAIFVFSLFFIFPLSSQNVSQDTLFAQMYRKLYGMNSDGQYAEVITEGETFLANVQVQDSFLLSYGNVLNVIGLGHFNYGTGDKAFWYTERALAIFTKLDHIRMSDAYNQLAECHYWYTQDYDKAVENCQQALAIHERKLKTCSPQKSSVYANLGLIYTAQLNYSAALASYNKALTCQNDDSDLGKLNTSLGDFYFSQSLYSKALTYFSKAEFHFKKFYGDNKDHPNIAVAYANEANCYQYMGEYTKAIGYFYKAKQIFDKKIGINHPNNLRIQAYIAFCYVSQGQYDEALNILKPLILENLDGIKGLKVNVLDKLGYCYAMKKQQKAFEAIMSQLVTETEVAEFSNLLHKVTIYRNIGVNYRVTKNYERSSIFYQKALRLMDSVEVKDEKTMNLIFLELANNAYDQKKTDEAIQYFEKVLNNRSDKEDKKSLEYYNTIYGLSLAYYQKFETAADKTSLNKAIELMNASVNIILDLRNDYIEQADKQYLNSDGNVVFDKLIAMLLRKNAIEPDSSFLKKCFVLSEQNKSMRLLEVLKGIEIGRATVIMDSIKMVKLTINTLENQIYAAQKDSSKSQVAFWQGQLFEAKQEHERFVNTLKKESEHYFKAIYQPEILSVESVQKLLNNDQTLLEYFVGDSSIFIFTVNKNNYKVTEVKKDFPLDDWIKQMRTGIYGSFLKHIQDDSLVIRTTQYVDAAKKLYDKLVAPVQNILRGSLVIISDALLGYVPFDALLTDKPSNLARPQNFNYLLNKHKISYCYSATLLNEMVKKEHLQKPEKLFLGITPNFTNSEKGVNRGRFNPLIHSIEEITKLYRMMGGDTLIGEKATKAVFMQNAGKYRIIHLSTHGKMDDKTGDDSFLVFAQMTDTSENELLYTRELYNLQLNADMVVLSACETGIGELQQGEGIISLSRAFAYAGSKSIVTTLWTVDDRTTKNLMLLFYQNLKAGKTKDDALWLAKRAFISANKGESALPFYWSGIIAIGDMGAIINSN